MSAKALNCLQLIMHVAQSITLYKQCQAAGIENAKDIRKSVQKQPELAAQPALPKPGKASAAGSVAKLARPATAASVPDAAPVASVSTMHRFLRKV